MTIRSQSRYQHARWLLRWRVHNAQARAHWHLQRFRERFDGGRDLYDDAFWNFHARGDWDALARAICEELRPEAVLDVGCGAATLLAAFSRVQPGIVARGLEHSPVARARASAAGVSVEDFDAAALDRTAREAWRRRLGHFDLVICFEVAEHLPPAHGRRLVALLTGWPRVLFSAAQPNQGGTGHVNEQPIDYWVRVFERQGMIVSARSSRLRNRIEAVDVPWWYSRNAILFERGERDP